MTKIVFFDADNFDKKFLNAAFDGKFDIEYVENSLNDMTELTDKQKQAQIISCFTTSRVSKEVLEKFPNLKLIALRSVGFNHIDTDYCKEHGIAVETTPNYGNMTVAEFAYALLLDVARRVTSTYMFMRNTDIIPRNTTGIELFGKTIGIVGLGKIGAESARIAFGFGMKILGYDKYEREDLKEKYGVQYVDFETLIKNSDFITLHAPATKDNYHLFDEKAFNKMKQNAIIVNTARGELIDTQALYNALKNKVIRGAGLDVLESEETMENRDYLNDIDRLNTKSLQNTIFNDRLLRLNNAIITPHIAYDTQEAIERILSTTVENINEFVQGRTQNNVIV